MLQKSLKNLIITKVFQLFYLVNKKCKQLSLCYSIAYEVNVYFMNSKCIFL